MEFDEGIRLRYHPDFGKENGCIAAMAVQTAISVHRLLFIQRTKKREE